MGMKYKEKKFELTGYTHTNVTQEKKLTVYVIDDEDGGRTMSIETPQISFSFPLQEIIEYLQK